MTLGTVQAASKSHLALVLSVSKLSRSSIVSGLDRYGTRSDLLLLRIIWLRTRTQSCSMCHKSPALAEAAPTLMLHQL